VRPGEALTDAKDQKQSHRAARQARRKEERGDAPYQRGARRGRLRDPAARIIIMIGWTNIAWLGQIRTLRSRTARTTLPAIATFRATATQPSNAGETYSPPDAWAARAAVSAAPETSGRSRGDRSPLIYDARASARAASPSWRRPGIRRLASRLSTPRLRPAWATANMPWAQMMPT
jgi:hypothetical protein